MGDLLAFAITQDTGPALTGLADPATIMPIHSGWGIPCSQIEKEALNA
jgi:hypothetical protein